MICAYCGKDNCEHQKLTLEHFESLRVGGWFEEYKCGCVSETVHFKKDLLGYCGTHGDERRHIYSDTERK